MAATAKVDILIIGGGINGVGIAYDAALRGLSVTLCEQGDLGGATSWLSSKLLHGGLRYLETGEFDLVREALHERDILLRTASHITQPLAFVLPHTNVSRPVWLIRLGLFLYQLLSGKKTLPGWRTINLQKNHQGDPLQDHMKKGFIYYDCKVDDARLVIMNALAAKNHGATILPRTKVTHAKRHNDYWEITATDQKTGKVSHLHAKTVINAAGPWVEQVLHDVFQHQGKHRLQRVKGSHIVVPRLYENDHAYILQNPDKRIVFIIPFEHDFHLIGTTDVPLDKNDNNEVVINDEEIDYLCASVNRYLKTPIHKEDIKWHYSGIRPLIKDTHDNPSKVTREYTIDIDDEDGAPLLTIFGGKITTYRRLAEKVISKLKRYLTINKSTDTANIQLPGAPQNVKLCSQKIKKDYPWLPDELHQHYLSHYGEMTMKVLSDCDSVNNLGEHFGNVLFEREVVYLIKNEWAQTIEDIIFRRTKVGLCLTKKECEKLKNFIKKFKT